MKINDSTPIKPKKFWDLKQGDVFKIPNNNQYFMKIEPVSDRTAIKCKAVGLEDGFVYDIHDNDTILPIDGEFVVKKVNA